MKKGLVLEGGGLKGLYTAGVIDVLLENNFTADIVTGTSAGVAFGCNFKSKQIGRVFRYVLKYIDDWRFASFKSWIKTGDYFGAKFCYETIPNELDVWDAKTFAENPCEYYSTATDIEKGQVVFHKLTDGGPNDIQWMRASSSVPLLSKIVELDGYKLLDGGMVCSIPLEKAIELGCEKNLVVCTKPKGFGKDGMNTKPLLRMAYRKYPNFVRCINECDKVYAKELEFVDESEKNGKAFVLRPSQNITENPAEHDKEKLTALYQLGRKDCADNLQKILAYFSGEGL